MIRVDFNEITGKIKPMHGVGQPPYLGPSSSYMHYLKEAGIPYSRLHDVCGPYGGLNYVDIPNVFKDFSADESDPKSYDSATTYITTLRAAESLSETSLCWTEIPAEFLSKFRRFFYMLNLTERRRIVTLCTNPTEAKHVIRLLPP